MPSPFPLVPPPAVVCLAMPTDQTKGSLEASKQLKKLRKESQEHEGQENIKIACDTSSSEKYRLSAFSSFITCKLINTLLLACSATS
jgi:hypothetical protein